MRVIDLREWNLTYTDLVNWCTETGADVYAVITPFGKFENVTVAIEILGWERHKFYRRVKQYPEQYYYEKSSD